jgi:uracil-DNA glycosylase
MSDDESDNSNSDNENNELEIKKLKLEQENIESFSIIYRLGKFNDFEDYIDNWCAPTWKKTFDYAKPDLKYIWSRIKNKSFHPDLQDVFRCFDLTPLNNVKVVILNNDLYPDKRTNTGLSFSVKKGMPFTPVLYNIFKEISEQYVGSSLTSGDLTNWALQGVLLLNAALTFVPQEKSQVGLYSGFIEKVLQAIISNNPKCVFLLWGKEAQDCVPDSMGSQCLKLKSSHPAPKTYADAKRGLPFKGNQQFIETNEFLQKNGMEEINWMDL